MRVEVEVGQVREALVVPERSLRVGDSMSHYLIHSRVWVKGHIGTRGPLILPIEDIYTETHFYAVYGWMVLMKCLTVIHLL